MFQTLGDVARACPEDRPRYLMGVGNPTTLVRAVREGVDMFDCVLPTRTGPHGHGVSSTGRMNMRNAKFTRDSAARPRMHLPTCQNHSRAYIRHLVKQNEMAWAASCCPIHNLHYLTRPHAPRPRSGAGRRVRGVLRAVDGKLRGEGLLAPFARRRIDCAAAFVRERSARSQAVDAHILESFLNPGRRKVLVDAPFDRVGGREVVCPGALAREHLEGDGDVGRP